MSLLKLLAVNLVFLVFFSCADRKPITIKEFHAEGLEDFLTKMKPYSSIESVFNIHYEGKNTLKGDASLKISRNRLLLRVYYMGFPAGEVYEENGEVNSNVLIEKEHLKQLTKGIRKGFLWWDGDFFVEEDTEVYILRDKNMDRVLVLDKSGFMPLRQIINAEGQTVLIDYDNYGKVQTEDGTVLNMPFRIVVLYKNRTLKINIEKLKLKNV